MGKIQPCMERLDKIFSILSVLWKKDLEEPLSRKCVFLWGKEGWQNHGACEQVQTWCVNTLIWRMLCCCCGPWDWKKSCFKALQPTCGEQHLHCSSFKCIHKWGDFTPEKGQPGTCGRGWAIRRSGLWSFCSLSLFLVRNITRLKLFLVPKLSCRASGFGATTPERQRWLLLHNKGSSVSSGGVGQIGLENLASFEETLWWWSALRERTTRVYS